MRANPGLIVTSLGIKLSQGNADGKSRLMVGEFKDKFVAFVDILGFKSMVETAEANDGLSAADLKEFRTMLGKPEDRAQFVKYGSEVCPDSAYIRRDLDFQVSQESDCVVVSAELSPAGVINLIDYCWRAAIRLLTKGVMVRGYITQGPILHDGDGFPMGTGYHKALDKERGVTAFKQEADELGTPFVEVDSVVCAYVANCGDVCVKKMFSRMVKEDESVTAIFPFQRLSHSFVTGGYGQKFDPEKEKASNQVIRESIKSLKERVFFFVNESNESAMKKASYYIKELDVQLAICDQIDENITALSAPFPPRQMREFYQRKK